MASPSLSAGMISVAFTDVTVRPGPAPSCTRCRFSRARARPRGPLELNPLASHQRALAPPRAASLTGRDKRAAPAHVRHLADVCELRRGEDAVGALRGRSSRRRSDLFQYTHGTMSPLGVMRTVWRPHPDPFLNGSPSIALRIGSVVLTSRAAASSRRNPSQNSSWVSVKASVMTGWYTLTR